MTINKRPSSIQGVVAGPPAPQASPRARVLVVDDEDAITRAYTRILEAAGYEVGCASEGEQAIRELDKAQYDVIVSDVAMRGMDGLRLLRAVRERSPELPMILVTAFPTVEAAIQAIEHGAARYLLKPVERSDLLQAVEHACKVSRVGRARRSIARLFETRSLTPGDRETQEERFSRFLASLELDLVPIMSWREQRVMGYEVVLCPEMLMGGELESVLTTATALGRLKQVGRRIRALLAERVPQMHTGTALFLDLRLHGLDDPELLDWESPLSKVARRVVLEVSELVSACEINRFQARIAPLRAMGYRIGLRDVGAGPPSVEILNMLSPDFVRLSERVVQGIDTDTERWEPVTELIRALDELGVNLIATGVGRAADRERLQALGALYLQGSQASSTQDPSGQAGSGNGGHHGMVG